eukprot:604386-Rhodomonas_salina.1
MSHRHTLAQYRTRHSAIRCLNTAHFTHRTAHTAQRIARTALRTILGPYRTAHRTNIGPKRTAHRTITQRVGGKWAVPIGPRAIGVRPVRCALPRGAQYGSPPWYKRQYHARCQYQTR